MRLEAAGVDPDLLAPFYGVTEEYIEVKFTTVDERWGGFDTYLRDALGVDGEGRAVLQEVMVDV